MRLYLLCIYWGPGDPTPNLGQRPQTPGERSVLPEKVKGRGVVFFCPTDKKISTPGPCGPTLDFPRLDMARQLRRRLREAGTSTCSRAVCYASVPYRPASACPPSRPPSGGRHRPTRKQVQPPAGAPVPGRAPGGAETAPGGPWLLLGVGYGGQGSRVKEGPERGPGWRFPGPP